MELYRIESIITGSYWYSGGKAVSSSLAITPTTGSFLQGQSLSTTYNTQYFRILRRVPDETSVLVSTYPQINVTSGEVGILIPENFNINYDPITIAKAAGLIS
jgi:hypothetical protein